MSDAGSSGLSTRLRTSEPRGTDLQLNIIMNPTSADGVLHKMFTNTGKKLLKMLLHLEAEKMKNATHVHKHGVVEI